MREGNAVDAEKTAFIYTRISLDLTGEGEGVERQETLCQELASRMGLTVIRTYTDNDTGASDRTRKSKVRHQYQAMLEAVRAGEARYIVAYSNSRLTRRMMELEDLINLHNETGVQIHTVVSGNDDLSTADGRMVARIKASVDIGESDRLSERSKARFRQKALTGEPRITSHRPFGWLPDGKTLDPVESQLIREGVAELIRGVPLNHIRQRWTEQGVKTPSGSTNWHWTNTLSVLTSWRTVGIRTYNGEVLHDAEGKPVRGNWEPIVTEEEREAALAQVRKRSLSRKRTGRYLLTGLLRCECGKSMWGNVASSASRSTQYACADATRHVSIDAARLEKHVLHELYARLTNRELQGRGLPEPAVKPWEGEARLATVVANIDQLMAAFNAGTLSGEVVFPQVTKLEAERDALRRQRDTYLATVAEPRREVRTGEDVAHFVGDLAKKDWPETQAVLRQEVETIVISKGVRGVQARDPEVFKKRVNIVWKPER